MEQNEFNIPVPWGHVAVKAWGNPNDSPILVIHGLSDNAGSFDRLLPLLPHSFYYACMELPGHGRSSPFPPHLPIHTLDFVLVYRLVLDHFNWQKCILMGHSWGAQVAIAFTQLYPEYATKLVLLDGIYLIPPGLNYKPIVRERLDKLYDMMKTGEKARTKYTYDEALKIITKRQYSEALNVDAAKTLLQRSTVEAGDGKYQFTLDKRSILFLNPDYTISFVVQYLQEHPITCPTLFLCTELLKSFEFMRPIVDTMSKRSNVEMHMMDENHDVHINYPEIVAPYINEFLLRGKSKL